jgi:hypothetical protein
LAKSFKIVNGLFFIKALPNPLNKMKTLLLLLLVSLFSPLVRGEDSKAKIVGQKQTVPDKPEVFFARATKYHKTDRNVDPWTARGQTSTRLTLPPESRVKCDRSIGNVALDPRAVPEGSLVFETQTRRFFVATTGGTAVIRRDAAKDLARIQGLSNKHRNALVFDFYYPYEIVDNHFTYCYVIPYSGETPFRNLLPEFQKLRLEPEFWIPIINRMYDETNDPKDQEKIRIMQNRMNEIIRSRNRFSAG